MSGGPLPLETARTRLRRLRADDLAAFHAYRSDPEVGRWQGWQPMDEAQARAFLHEMAASAFCPPGQWFQLAIADRASDALLGDIGIQLHGEPGVMAEVGFTLGPAAQGRGLATEAVGACLALLLQHTAVQRIVAVADVRNEPSLRLLARLGLRPYAVLAGVAHGQPCLEQHWIRHRAGRLGVKLRPGRPADAAAAAEVLQRSRQVLMPYVPSRREPAEVERWLREELLPAGGVTLAEHGGRVAGVLAVRKAADAHWIDQLYVHPSQVAGGVGAALLARAFRLLADPARPLRLHCFQANLHARAFYERHGFQARSFGDGSANEEGCPDVLYERPATA